MNQLSGIRIHLSGSVPEDATEAQADGITRFVRLFASVVLSQGGTLTYGSHPSLIDSLREAAMPFVRAGGARDATTLVRLTSFASTPEQKAEIAAQREWCVVNVIPLKPGSVNDSLVPMRDWMAERSDVVVAVGGKWYKANQSRAGVPLELLTMLGYGKPGFIVAGFGGAIAGYLKDNETILSKLHNGWNEETNRQMAASTDLHQLVSAIMRQLTFLPLLKGKISNGRLFRILCLDGGGLRGTFTAAVLAKWAQMLPGDGGHDLVKHFDLVAGTSTGAILAIGLGLGLTPSEVLMFYRTKGPKIFQKNREIRHWLRSKHDSETLEATLTGVFAKGKLSQDSICRLVIPTVRAQRGNAEVIVTAHSPDRTGFKDYSAVQAAMASSAAPTYFDEAVVADEIAEQSYIDGGVWANNPALAALVEAVHHLGIPLERIDLLSLGTLGNEADFTKSLGTGKTGWAASSVDLFFAAQESGISTLAEGLVSRARYLRVNQATPSEIKLDAVDAINDMARRGENMGQDTFEVVRSRFLDGIHASDWRTLTAS